MNLSDKLSDATRQKSDEFFALNEKLNAGKTQLRELVASVEADERALDAKMIELQESIAADLVASKSV